MLQRLHPEMETVFLLSLEGCSYTFGIRILFLISSNLFLHQYSKIILKLGLIFFFFFIPAVPLSLLPFVFINSNYMASPPSFC